MAQIGLRYPVAAPIMTYNPDGMPVYGTGFYIGRAIKADKTYDKNDASLFADDGRAEYDAGVTAVNLSIEIDGIGTHVSAFGETPIKVEATLLGATYDKSSSGANGEIEQMTTSADDVPPYFGVGYYKTDVINGKKHFFVYLIYKMAFSKPDDSDSTKGEKTSFGTKTINGTGMSIDGSDVAPKRYFEKKLAFQTEAAAIAFLKKTLNLSDTADSSGTTDSTETSTN